MKNLINEYKLKINQKSEIDKEIEPIKKEIENMLSQHKDFKQCVKESKILNEMLREGADKQKYLDNFFNEFDNYKLSISHIKNNEYDISFHWKSKYGGDGVWLVLIYDTEKQTLEADC